MALINGHQMAAGDVFDTIMAVAYQKAGVGTEHTWFSAEVCRDCPSGEFCTIRVGIGIKHVTVGPRGGKKKWWTDEHRLFVTKGEIEAMLRDYPLSGILTANAS